MKNNAQEAIETTQQESSVEVNELEYEIQCPRCSDVMALRSTFDCLYYTCDECGFVLSNFVRK